MWGKDRGEVRSLQPRQNNPLPNIGDRVETIGILDKERAISVQDVPIVQGIFTGSERVKFGGTMFLVTTDEGDKLRRAPEFVRVLQTPTDQLRRISQ